MDGKFKFCLPVVLLILSGLAIGQTSLPREARKASASSAEIVSFSQSTGFDQALSILDDLSQKFVGKSLVYPKDIKSPIGVNIQREHWLTALEMILRKRSLWYREFGNSIQVIAGSPPGNDSPEAPVDPKSVAMYETREVVLSAVFFEIDASKLKQIGTNWSFLREDGDPTVGVLSSSGDFDGSLFEVNIASGLDGFGSLDAFVRALEDDQVGEVISRPTITVKSGAKGRIQVGSDISVNIKDFAGNSVTQFFSTGTIITVQPQIMSVDSVQFIHLEMEIERSSSVSEEGAGVEIRKSQAETSMLLLDGEETMIAGLNINQENVQRSGVPFLKDLPGWFFGLRYVFGYESRNVVKKELLILVRAELLPDLRSRFYAKQRAGQNRRDLLKEKREENRQELYDYRRQAR